MNNRKLITLPLQNTRVDTNTQFTRLLNSYNNLIDPLCRFVNRSNAFKTSSLWTSSLNFSWTDRGASLAGRITGLQSGSTWRLPLPGSVQRPLSKTSAYLTVRSSFALPTTLMKFSLCTVSRLIFCVALKPNSQGSNALSRLEIWPCPSH